jgi:hypothetical protein
LTDDHTENRTMAARLEIYFMGMSGHRLRRGVKFLAVVWSIGAGFLVLQALFVRVSDFSLGHFAPAEMALAKQSAAGAAHCREVLKTFTANNQGTGRASRYRAWRLGYQLGVADGGTQGSARVMKILADAQTLAHSLGVPEVALPSGHAAYGIRDFTVSLEEDPQCVSAALAMRYSPRHASLYKFGAAVGLAMVYRAAISDAEAVLEPEIRAYGRAASVPQALWQPLLEKQIAVQAAVSRIDGYIRAVD